MKRIKLEEITGLTGVPFIIPMFDETDKPITKMVPVFDTDGKVVRQSEEYDVLMTKNLLDILAHFILRGIPAKSYTKKDAIHVGNIYRSIAEARKDTTEVLELGEDDHDWLKNKLNDEAIGVKMFMRNIPIVLDAVDNIIKPHQPKVEEKV